MFEDLHNAIDAQNKSKNSFTLITDTVQAEGGFILQHYLNKSLKNGQYVCFLALEQSFFHYFNISRKLVEDWFFYLVIYAIITGIEP